ncbi:MAG: YhgE/Pip domain-containing protein, partial [Stackebrandtia sp.]
MTAVRLALLELRRFRGHPIRSAALAAVILMPLLYAGLYLWSSWDPYGRMDRVPVAVVNEDEGATMDGKELRAGDELTDQLKQTSYLDWNFVSASEAERGMTEGDYYFSIVVPKDFSKDLSTLSGLDPKRAHVMVDLDDANGYIVGIMAKTIEAELQNQINTAVYVTFARTMFGNLTELDEG